jgi:S1-C subfamily serine protease
MFRSIRLLAPVAAAIVAAGGGVVAVSHATDSTQSQPPAGPAGRQGLALQSAFVKVVSSISGALVGAVTPGGAAGKAGIRAGDTIESVHESPTPTTVALAAVLAELRPGQKVPVVVEHGNGAKAIMQVTLGAYPGS